jgi:hypothetical protein
VRTDVVLGAFLLSGPQAFYGVVSLGILGVSLLLQAFVVKSFGNVAWLSKDVLFTCLALGPLLQAYRCVFGEQRNHDWNGAEALLAQLKGIEVAFETLPEVALKCELTRYYPVSRPCTLPLLCLACPLRSPRGRRIESLLCSNIAHLIDRPLELTHPSTLAFGLHRLRRRADYRR